VSWSSYQNLLSRLRGVRLQKEHGRALCPVHQTGPIEDHPRGSLGLKITENDTLALYCHLGCAFEEIKLALGVRTLSELDQAPPTHTSRASYRRSPTPEHSPPPHREQRARTMSTTEALAPHFGTPQATAAAIQQATSQGNGPVSQPVATYIYRDEQSKELFKVERFTPKRFAQSKHVGKDAVGRSVWQSGVTGVRRVLYRLPELAQEVGRVAFVVEGEKAVDYVRHTHGLSATCWPGGTDSWNEEFAESLVGRHVVVIADHDPVGATVAAKIAESLRGKALSVKVLFELPGCEPTDGLDDWLQLRGGTKEQLRDIVKAADYWVAPAGHKYPTPPPDNTPPDNTPAEPEPQHAAESTGKPELDAIVDRLMGDSTGQAAVGQEAVRQALEAAGLKAGQQAGQSQSHAPLNENTQGTSGTSGTSASADNSNARTPDMTAPYTGLHSSTLDALVAAESLGPGQWLIYARSLLNDLEGVLAKQIRDRIGQ
jgi:hypothetical protein